MKSKILLVGILIAVLLLTGCVMTFNLCNWSSSNSGFNNLISTLNTPNKAIDWLKDNCKYVSHSIAYSPYQVYAYKKYVCADASVFGRYAAHKHGYESWDLILQFSDFNKSHSIAIYKVGGTYDNSSNASYRDWNDSSLWTAANNAANDYTAHTVKSWYINDYCNNVVDFEGITASTKFYNFEGLEPAGVGTFIGNEPIDRSSYMQTGTFIDKNNPAQFDGIIEQVAIYAKADLSDVVIATFYEISIDHFTTRDYEEIGAVVAGSRHEFEVNISVYEGDYIGMYFSSGQIERSTSGYDGFWAIAGDWIPCTNKWFSSFTEGDCISLGGFIISP